MNEVFSGITSGPLWLLILAVVGLYIGIVGSLRMFLRPALVGNFDPFNIELILYKGPAIVGFILAPFLINATNQSYYLILAFLGLWIAIVRIVGKPIKVDLRDEMGANFQNTLLFIVMIVIGANITVNMIIPGKIPLLADGTGVSSRFDATENSRILTWLSFATAEIPGLIYAVTQNPRIRRLAIIAVGLQAIESLLFASKSGILTIVFVFLGGMFIAKARHEHERYRKLRRLLFVSISLVALLVPTYFSAIGFGGPTETWVLLATRFLGGFDQLILAAQFDLLRHAGFDPLIKTDIIHYQLMPLFKVFSSTQYEYNGIGEYVIEYVTGIPVSGRGAYPNSNLILETIFTSGKYLGVLIFTLELIVFYCCRRTALKKPVTPLTLVLVQAFVMTPMGLFSSGQDWIMETLIAFITILAALVLSHIWMYVSVLMRSAVVSDVKRSTLSS